MKGLTAGTIALFAALASSLPAASAADCSAAAQKVVAQTGGQLLSATPVNGGASCEVTVLVPGNGNERPKKVTVTVSS